MFRHFPRSSHRRMPIATALWALFSGVLVAQADYPREVAAFGPEPNQPVWEPYIAVGPDAAITVFNDRWRGTATKKIGYAIYDRASQQWTEDLTDPNGSFSNLIDSSVAYSPATEEFLLCGLLGSEGAGVARCFDDPNDGWTVAPWSLINMGGDRPRLVTGEVFDGQYQEHYVVAWKEGPDEYNYRRWRGRPEDDWEGGRIVLNRDPNKPVTGTWIAQPTVYGDSPLYIAYVRENRDKSAPPDEPNKCEGATIRFLKGTDIDDPNDPNDGEVEFKQLTGLAGPLLSGPVQPVPLQVSLNCGAIKYFIPYYPSWFASKFDRVTPEFAVDPTNTNRMYLVYHDLRKANGALTSNVDVFLHKLTKGAGRWFVGPRRRVNPVDYPGDYDQFLPTVTVDLDGRVHVLYYSDENYPDQDDGLLQDPNDPNETRSFDAYYAFSENRGVD